MSIGPTCNPSAPPSAPTPDRAPRGIRIRSQERGPDANDAPAGQPDNRGEDPSPHDRERATPSDESFLALGEGSQPPDDGRQEVDDLVDDLPDENDLPDEPVIEEPVRVLDVLPTAPVATASVVPNGWTLSPGGVARGVTLVLYSALAIVHRLVDGDGTEMLELAFYRDSVWYHREVTREQIATNQRIIGLSRIGLPITAMNARAVMAYLADYEGANLGSIPAVRLTRRTGWHTINGQDIFVLGDRVFMEGADPDNEHEQPEVIRLRASGDGPVQIAAGLGTAGTLAGWLEIIALIGPYPRAAVRVLRRARAGAAEDIGLAQLRCGFLRANVSRENNHSAHRSGRLGQSR